MALARLVGSWIHCRCPGPLRWEGPGLHGPLWCGGRSERLLSTPRYGWIHKLPFLSLEGEAGGMMSALEALWACSRCVAVQIGSRGLLLLLSVQ